MHERVNKFREFKIDPAMQCGKTVIYAARERQHQAHTASAACIDKVVSIHQLIFSKCYVRCPANLVCQERLQWSAPSTNTLEPDNNSKATPDSQIKPKSSVLFGHRFGTITGFYATTGLLLEFSQQMATHMISHRLVIPQMVMWPQYSPFF